MILIYTTTSTVEEADLISNALLEKKLAACVTTAPIFSKFWWEGKIEESEELQLIIKTKDELYFQVEELITELHSYACPQIIQVEVSQANIPYLEWVEENTK